MSAIEFSVSPEMADGLERTYIGLSITARSHAVPRVPEKLYEKLTAGQPVRYKMLRGVIQQVNDTRCS